MADYLRNFIMMKLLSAQQLHAWDEYTMAQEPITSINLMERAAWVCVQWIEERGYCSKSIIIFCGKGNNGGDGLAIARLLIEKGYQPAVYINESGKKGSTDFEVNLERLQKLSNHIYTIQAGDAFPFISNNDLLIDALFGSGLNRFLESHDAALVAYINQSAATVIAIDVPSGMAINFSCNNKPVIKASHTLTFQVIKRCFLMAENADYFGELTVLNIGLNKSFIENLSTEYEIVSKELIREKIRPRSAFSHKGTFGHALLVAGNKGKLGAAVLAARACLRAGVGLLTVNVPEKYATIIHTAVPEAMQADREIPFPVSQYKSIGIGPGLGTDTVSAEIVHSILTGSSNAMVIDADALTILSMNKAWLASVPANAVLTPHPKEFDRLFGNCENDFERADKALALSQTFPFIIVLKGHYTLIAANGKGWYNNTGNAGLAKGGSGDVLTGIITALLAQQYSPEDAALIAVYLHGVCADITLEQQSMESMIATDIIEIIGKAFLSIVNSH